MTVWHTLLWHSGTVLGMFPNIFSNAPVIVTKHKASPPNKNHNVDSEAVSQFSTKDHNQQPRKVTIPACITDSFLND